MADGVNAYPLNWPHHRPRVPAVNRRPGAFRSSIESIIDRSMVPVKMADARERLADMLYKIGASSAVLSTNLELRMGGEPRASQAEPSDPGVAMYFYLGGSSIVLACDRYDTVAANTAAIAVHLEATLAIERHGVGTLEQMFAGFSALPPPGRPPWRAVLDFPIGQTVTVEMVQAKRRDKARLHHADAGGSGSRMAEINAAADKALKDLR